MDTFLLATFAVALGTFAALSWGNGRHVIAIVAGIVALGSGTLGSIALGLYFELRKQ